MCYVLFLPRELTWCKCLMITIDQPSPPEISLADNLTYLAAAKRLGVSLPTIRRWAYSGRLKIRKYSATCVRVPRSEVERLEREALV
jgi:excisionase family DNA binding protein